LHKWKLTLHTLSLTMSRRFVSDLWHVRAGGGSIAGGPPTRKKPHNPFPIAITRLHNQSIDVSQLKADNFGEMVSGGIDGAFHKLIQNIIPKVEMELDTYLKKQNKIHLNNMMSTLQLCIEMKGNVERLIKMQTGRPQYMFVDEFQDTDDVQIEAISQIAKLLQYKLFDVKK